MHRHLPLKFEVSIEASTVLHAWNKSHGEAYQIRSCDFEWNLNQQNFVRYSAAELAGVPALLAVATEAGIATGIPRGTLWLSLWGAIPDGGEKAFLSALESAAKKEGRTKVMFGSDEFHFVSGVPTLGGAKLIAALKAEGYDTAGDVVDFTGDLATSAITTYIANAKKIAAEGRWTLLPAEPATLRDFMAKEFPGRWTREFDFWRDRDDTQRALWSLLRKENVVCGFARMALRSGLMPLDAGWNPGALRAPLGEPASWLPNDSCLGPIGVAATGRGQGAGRVLLGLVLEHLLVNKAQRVCVDWTNAFKYYYPLHLHRTRTNWTAWKAIP